MDTQNQGVDQGVDQSVRKIMRRGSIYDVARTAGVASATVSRVINDMPGVSDEMRELIRQVMDQLGYQPRPPDKRRGPKKKATVPPANVIDLCIVFPLHLGHFPRQAPIYSRLLDELEDVSNKSGVELHIRQYGAFTNSEINTTLIGQIYFGGSGVILPNSEIKGVSPLPSIALLGNIPNSFPGDIIQVDNWKIGELAARHFLSLGHKNAGYIGSSLPEQKFLLSLRGSSFVRWFQKSDGNVEVYNEPNLINCTNSENSVNRQEMHKALTRIFAKNKQVTALFLESSMLLADAYAWLIEHGMKPQVDVRILACNRDEIYLEGLYPAPDIIDVPCRQLAELAIDCIVCGRKNLPKQYPVSHLVSPGNVEILSSYSS